MESARTRARLTHSRRHTLPPSQSPITWRTRPWSETSERSRCWSRPGATPLRERPRRLVAGSRGDQVAARDQGRPAARLAAHRSRHAAHLCRSLRRGPVRARDGERALAAGIRRGTGERRGQNRVRQADERSPVGVTLAGGARAAVAAQRKQRDTGAHTRARDRPLLARRVRSHARVGPRCVGRARIAASRCSRPGRARCAAWPARQRAGCPTQWPSCASRDDVRSALG